MIQDADAIIMGAPCYWGNIPGQMKLLFDRIVYGMMRDTPRFPEPLMKGKKCILLSTCTTPWPWNIWFKQSRGAIRAMREICRYSGFKIVATIERGGTAMHPQLSEKDKLKCLKAIRRLSRLFFPFSAAFLHFSLEIEWNYAGWLVLTSLSDILIFEVLNALTK